MTISHSNTLGHTSVLDSLVWLVTAIFGGAEYKLFLSLQKVLLDSVDLKTNEEFKKTNHNHHAKSSLSLPKKFFFLFFFFKVWLSTVN